MSELPPPPPPAEKVLDSIEVGSGWTRYGLYFTPKRVIVAKTFYPTWIQFVILFWLWAPFIGITRSIMTGASIRMGIGSFIAIVALMAASSFIDSRMKKKVEELSQLLPEIILTANEKNFGIPYNDITRVEMKRRKSRLADKMRLVDKMNIFTKKEKHEFAVMRKKLDNRLIDLIRRVLPNKTYVS